MEEKEATRIYDGYTACPVLLGAAWQQNSTGGIEVEGKEVKERCHSSIFSGFLFVDISMSKNLCIWPSICQRQPGDGFHGGDASSRWVLRGNM